MHYTIAHIMHNGKVVENNYRRAAVAAVHVL